MPEHPLTGRALKVVVMLDPAEIAPIPMPPARMTFAIKTPDRSVLAQVMPRALRKAQAAIEEHGADNVAAFIQGKLVGNKIEDAGLVCQLKLRSKPVEAEVA